MQAHKSHIRNFLIISLVTIFFGGISADVSGQELSIDSSYSQAREWASAGMYDNTRKICNYILDSIPEHHDAKILLALTFSWENNFDTARTMLQDVIKEEPGYWDALNAMTDIGIWDNKLDTALYFSNQGLKYHPKDLNFLVKKARILIDLERYDEAERVLLEILEEDPDNSDVAKLMEKMEKIRIRNKIMIEYDFEFYEKPWSRRWHLFALSYERKTKIGSIIGRVYAGDMVRTGDDALFNNGAVFQYEIEAYPRFSRNNYAFVNYSYSPDSLFPEHRVGLEFYQKLPWTMEVSLGGRYMKFVSSTGKVNEVYIITGSLSKYYRQYWFSFRPYISPQENGVDQSYNLMIRRYIKSADNFVFLELATGNSPDDPTRYFGGFDTYSLNSYRVRSGFQWLFLPRWVGYFEIGYAYEEYRDKEYRNAMRAGVKIGYYF